MGGHANRLTTNRWVNRGGLVESCDRVLPVSARHDIRMLLHPIGGGGCRDITPPFDPIRATW